MAFHSQRAQSLGTVPADAGEEDAHGITPPPLYYALEECSNGWAVRIIGWHPGIGKTLGAGKHEVIVFARDEDFSRLRMVAGFCQKDLEISLIIEPVNQSFGKLSVHVLNDDNRRRKI